MAFLWGAATSSHQVEGDNRHNDWWHWEHKDNIEGGVRSGKATDHLLRFREDLELAKSLGLSSYRFSIEWSRLQPKENMWDESALDWYEALISECERLRLVPMAKRRIYDGRFPPAFSEVRGASRKALGRSNSALVYAERTDGIGGGPIPGLLHAARFVSAGDGSHCESESFSFAPTCLRLHSRQDQTSSGPLSGHAAGGWDRPQHDRFSSEAKLASDGALDEWGLLAG